MEKEMLISRLHYDEETERFCIDGEELHCGDTFEVLIVRGDGKIEWIETRLEMGEGREWYLVGLWGIEPRGLFARFTSS